VTRVVLASSNPGKLRELAALLAPLSLTLIPQGALGIAAVPESGATFLANALLKARHAAQCARLPALADDCNPLHTCFVFQSLQLFFGSHPVLYIVSLFAAALTIELMSSASDFRSRWFRASDHGNLLGCQHAGRSADPRL